MDYDLLALGETMLALAPPAGGTLRGAAALLVDHAGAESNTASASRGSDFDVAWISRLGADAAGDRILNALQSESVDTRWVDRDPKRRTGMMLKDPGVGVRYYRIDPPPAHGPRDPRRACRWPTRAPCS